ncbi:hypothetical protein GH714_014911 [Hevea brasiliensis]|uniref:Exostosin GT47 domain-containing protein n=1 Tax=Hevea brasiliensis TaxID=3981 RepID=A0A6A6LJI8_HEVBR|nr:hypothetical protein GH714_014911 [Hevea brasiliensis]
MYKTEYFSKSTIVSRVLFESTNSTFLQHPKNNQGLLKDLKIYIYELPPKYNTKWLANERCSNHLFASEVAIHRALSNSDDVRTFDPYEADFFFVPVYVSCNFSTVNGFPAIGHARSLLSSAINLISTNFPFWNRSQGADHVFVASHDFGSCFHTLEGEDGDMEEIQRRPEVLLAETQICRLPVRDSTVGVLFMSIGVGPMESKTGRIRSVGLRAGNNSRWYPVAFPHRCSLAGDIPHGCGKGRGKAGEDS